MIGLCCGYTFTFSSTMYLGLSSTAINTSGSGITEPDVSSGYQRCAIAMNQSNWSQPLNGIIMNKNVIAMSEIEIAYGYVNYWFLSASINGTAKIYNQLSEPYLLDSNTRVYVYPNELKFGINNVIL